MSTPLTEREALLVQALRDLIDFAEPALQVSGWGHMEAFAQARRVVSEITGEPQ